MLLFWIRHKIESMIFQITNLLLTYRFPAVYLPNLPPNLARWNHKDPRMKKQRTETSPNLTHHRGSFALVTPATIQILFCLLSSSAAVSCTFSPSRLDRVAGERVSLVELYLVRQHSSWQLKSKFYRVLPPRVAFSVGLRSQQILARPIPSTSIHHLQ